MVRLSCSVLRRGQELFALDQHAADERIRLEKIYGEIFGDNQSILLGKSVSTKKLPAKAIDNPQPGAN